MSALAQSNLSTSFFYFPVYKEPSLSSKNFAWEKSHQESQKLKRQYVI